ncbi:MAG TPA: PP2C family protein-serine/threonine phosphatase [Acidimicrobiales bacterium]|jgi:serine phosphatase RsbU (regulator of sigma subunit)|nr:PP2C family protein-serine/threonine phosphatase [Acidimicrobiales bacterium]
MRDRSPDQSELAAMQRELADTRAELDERRRRDAARTRLDAVAGALIGDLDPESILERAERWATAVLGRPCTILREPPDLDDGAVPLGGDDPSAWLRLGDQSRSDEDDELVRSVADQIGRALEAANRMTTQADALRRLESSLLPDALLPVPGLQIASRYVPAPGSHDVSGDFYDAVRVGEGVTLIVGDVQGKGIEAATLTSLARHTLRAGAFARQKPGELLRQLNRALLYGHEEQLAAGDDRLLKFVTAAVACLEPRADDPETFDLTVVRAGQPPPLIVRSDGNFDPVEPRGVLLGVCEEPTFEEARATLTTGDTLVLYTDGVIEQRVSADRAMSEQRLGQLVRNRRGVVDAEAIAQLIEDTVRLVAPDEVRDDVAILVACVTRGAQLASR